MDITAEDFNDLYDVGTPVFFWPGWRKDEKGKDIPAMVSKTSTPAWEMPGGQQVVTVEGRAGGMWLQHVEVIPDYIAEHLKTSEEARAASTLGVVGSALDQSVKDIFRLLEPYYIPSVRTVTECDGKCAKVEDLEEDLESAKGATKVAAKLSDELLEKHLASETKAAQLEEALASAQRRASEWENRALAAEQAHISVLEQRTDDHAEIERLRGVLRLNELRLERERDNLTVFRGVIGQKEQELAVAEERVRELLGLHEEDQTGKIEELRGMLATQHARLTVLEGDLGSKTRDYNNIEAKFVEARQKLEVAEADLADCQEEREQIYMLLDPETPLEDRRLSPVDLLRNLIEENQLLKENPHKGCRQLEAGLNKQLQAMTASRDNAFQKLDELRNQVLDVVRSNVRAKPSD